ncbi:uncharacterized protein LOC119103849 [Pollicipes pollicipes]|uniref:uncharacterized protein LOC119103849 n=1 Tax=Pollicipes pollicipes TaxID=41117 RepID=UPI0018852474|nr:uncharacterized protein LOC119103849 [Pollicipes pollicipes]
MGPLLMAVVGALLLHGGALARPQTENDVILNSQPGDTSTIPADETQFINDLLGDTSPPKEVVRCESGQHVCTPHFRCDEANIITDGLGQFDLRINKPQVEDEFDFFMHSECPRFGDVCCTRPKRA